MTTSCHTNILEPVTARGAFCQLVIARVRGEPGGTGGKEGERSSERISAGFESGSQDYRGKKKVKERKKNGVLWWRRARDSIEQKLQGLQAFSAPTRRNIY